MTTNVPTVISARTERCLRLLHGWRSNKESGPEADDADSHLRLWATNNFIFTDNHMSIDWRLRHMGVLSGVICDLLDEFEQTVQEIIKATAESGTCPMPSNMGFETSSKLPPMSREAILTELETLRDVQARLFDICRAIHRSGVLSRLSKLAHYQQILRIGDKDINMTQEFREGISRYMNKRYFKASGVIRLRLADTVSLRRQNLLYLRDREAEAGRVTRDRHTEAISQPVIDVKKPQRSPEQPSPATLKAPIDPGHTVKTRPSLSIFSASTVNSLRLTKPASVRSSVTFAASSRLGISKMIPPAPRTVDSGYVKCPYCFLVCRKEDMRGELWRKHFLQDLMPYVCLPEDCSTPNVLFESFKDWSDHMKSQHPIATWVCTNKAHRRACHFQTSEECKGHMQSHHADDYDAKFEPTDGIVSHVAEHLIILAFSSLPDDDEQGCNSEDGSGLSLSDPSFEHSSRLEPGTSDQTHREEEIEDENPVLSQDIDGFYDITPTTSNPWSGMFKGNPLPTYELPNEDQLKSLRYRSWIPEAASSKNRTIHTRFTYERDGLVPIEDNSKEPLARLLREYKVWGVDGYFWTERLLRHIMTKDRILAELNKCRWIDRQAEKYAKIIRSETTTGLPSETYLKIFALLLLVDRVASFDMFVEEGVCDEKLPLKFEDQDEDDPYCFSTKEPRKNLSCFRSWDLRDRDDFNLYQWRVIGPFFDLTSKKQCKEFSLGPETCRPWQRVWERRTGIELEENAGAYGTVARVNIHPTSHGFHEILSELNINANEFAIKTVHWGHYNSEIHYRRELDHLKRFNGLVHPHLVPMLATFKYGDEYEYNFIFPSGTCDLESYLSDVDPNWDLSAARWVSKQLAGIMGAVDAIHNLKLLDRDTEQKYGRHGDIRRDNILCFCSPTPDNDLLVLSDSEPLDTHCDTSLSTIPGKGGYRPPECDITGGKVSRAFDIWTVGCLFLDFLTWFLDGPKFLEQFEQARTTPYIHGFKTDIFFCLKKVENSPITVAQVKSEVKEWIQMLRGHEHCSQFILDVLELVEENMLIVIEETRKRLPSGQLLRQLNMMQQRCAIDEEYCLRSVAARNLHERARIAPAVEVEISELVQRIIEQNLVSLPVHTGETKKPGLLED